MEIMPMKKLLKKLASATFVLVFIFSICAIFLTKTTVVYQNSNLTHAQTSETPSSKSSSAKNNLDGISKGLYEFLAEKITLIATGERDSTRLDIYPEDMTEWGAKSSWTKDEIGKSSISLDDVSDLFFEQFKLSEVVMALLHDLPYEFYWFDKTTGYGSQIQSSSTSSKVNIVLYTIYFHVTGEYKGASYTNGNTCVDTTKTASTSTILNNAKSIVETYKNLNDFQKLLSYKNKICELVAYNDSASLPTYHGGYGNPWQVIYVFDNITSTNVVCEGYAKAFQLLCNLSTFESDSVACYTVTGTMSGGTGEGGHMWNIVTMDDGFSYLVDITNSDTGTVGSDGELFLKGYATGTVSQGFNFALSSNTTFTYDSDTTTLWGTESFSILNISQTNYTEDFTEVLYEVCPTTYNGEPIAITFGTSAENGISFKLEDGTASPENYSWSCNYFEDNNGTLGEALNQSPKNAEKYWIKVTATKNDLTDQATLTMSFEIAKKQLEVESVTGVSRNYNNTQNISLINIEISGVVEGDDVRIVSSSVIAKVSSKDVGTYNKLSLSNFVLVGTDKDNYKTAENYTDFETEAITISQSTPTTTEEFELVTESGKTLADIEIEIIGKGVVNETLSGTFVWIDEDGNILDSSTKITKYTKYKYLFTPNNLNYASVESEIVLWDDKGEDDKFNIITFAKQHKTEIAIGAVIIVVLIIIISTSKKKTQRKKMSE